MKKGYPLKQIRREMTSTDMRGAFTDALCAYKLWADGEPEPTVELGHHSAPISAACRFLFDHSDMMPSYIGQGAGAFLRRLKLGSNTRRCSG